MTDRTVSSLPPRSRAASTTSPRRAGRRRLRRGDESGAVLVEFALVFVIFIFLLYALITFGVILAQKHAVTNAAADGARSAVGATTDPAAQSLAETRIVQALGAPDGRYTSTYSFAPCGGTHRCITVQVTWDYKNHPLVPPAPALGLVTPDTFGAKAVVQYM